MKKIFNKLTFGRIVIYVLVIILIVTGIMFLIPAHTDSITDSRGNIVLGSIAEMEKVEIGGVEQWLVIRGKSVEKPILLMLSGGPGSSEMGRFLEYNSNLEDDFIVVNWEQRGCGKSYSAVEYKKELKVEDYVSDINELTNYLKKRFDKKKIFLLGHSWGTIIGTLAVEKYPEQFHAYIGAAQMVNVLETDKYMYHYVLNAAESHGDTELVKELKNIGEPPYFGEGMLNKYRRFLSTYGGYYRRENPFNEKNTEWYSISSMIFFDEYSLRDKIGYFLGLLNTFPVLYQQLQDLDFVTQASKLEVPVYYLIGKHDYTAKFIEDYFNALEAPSKELIWFEQSSHGEIWTEPDKFHDIMVNKVLPETLQDNS